MREMQTGTTHKAVCHGDIRASAEELAFTLVSPALACHFPHAHRMRADRVRLFVAKIAQKNSSGNWVCTTCQHYFGSGEGLTQFHVNQHERSTAHM